jgi:AraC-like DNA-binding protein
MKNTSSVPSPDIDAIAPMIFLMDAVQDMRFVVKDKECLYLYVNPCWLETNGLKSAAKVVGKTASEVFPHWRAERYLREEKRVIEEGYVYNYEEFLLNVNGELERWRTVKAPWMVAGKVCGYLNIGTRLGSKDLEQRRDKTPEIVQAIAAKACQPMSIEKLALSLGISRRTLERRFKGEMDMTPLEFRMKCRILRARKMLLDGVNASEVSDACGFSDQSHFCKAFAVHVGTTPKKFQLQSRRKVEK